MLDTLLDDLYYGKIHPWEDAAVLTPEMKKVSDEVNSAIRRLEPCLSPEAKCVFEAMMSSRAYIEGLCLAESFKQGFRLGSQLILATLHPSVTATEGVTCPTSAATEGGGN